MNLHRRVILVLCLFLRRTDYLLFHKSAPEITITISVPRLRNNTGPCLYTILTTLGGDICLPRDYSGQDYWKPAAPGTEFRMRFDYRDIWLT
jgi:hypothetical protein